MEVEDLEQLVVTFDNQVYELREKEEEEGNDDFDELPLFWEHFYYGSPKMNEDGSYDWSNRDPVALADGSTAKYAAHEEFLRFGDKILRVIVEIDGEHFACEGWNDSWGGEGGFDGPVYRVVPEEVVTTTWKKVV